jgi:hypothetical protein
VCVHIQALGKAIKATDEGDVESACDALMAKVKSKAGKGKPSEKEEDENEEVEVEEEEEEEQDEFQMLNVGKFKKGEKEGDGSRYTSSDARYAKEIEMEKLVMRVRALEEAGMKVVVLARVRHKYGKSATRIVSIVDRDIADMEESYFATLIECRRKAIEAADEANGE